MTGLRTMSSEEYHAAEGLSQSMLKKLKISPAHLKHYLDNPPEPTSAMNFGNGAHCAILEPHLFKNRFDVKGQCCVMLDEKRQCKNNGKVRAGGYWYCATHGKVLENIESITALTQDEMIGINRIVKNLKEIPILENLMEGKKEVSAFWVDKETGVQCKGRFDLLSEHNRMILDFKTTHNAEPKAFSKQILDMSYYIQAPYYLWGANENGVDVDAFSFIAVENKEPYQVAIYELYQDAIDQGEKEMRTLIRQYADCLEKDKWPGFYKKEDGVEVIDLPYWYYNN